MISKLEKGTCYHRIIKAEHKLAGLIAEANTYNKLLQEFSNRFDNTKKGIENVNNIIADLRESLKDVD